MRELNELRVLVHELSGVVDQCTIVEGYLSVEVELSKTLKAALDRAVELAGPDALIDPLIQAATRAWDNNWNPDF